MRVFSTCIVERARGLENRGAWKHPFIEENHLLVVFQKTHKTYCPLRWRHSLCQIRRNSSEAARVIALILKECLVNFSQGVDPSEIDNFLLYLYSSEYTVSVGET